MLYGANVWDPLLIIAQIVSVQCLFYLSLGLWEAIFIAPYVGARLTVAHLFDWRLMSFTHFTGWMVIAANVANAPMGALFLVWVVERAKKCLDYASTCYLFHFIGCCVHSGFPKSLPWWGTNLLGLLIMSLMGEWLCVQREMADIPLSTLRERRSAAAAAASTGAAAGSSGGSASASGRQPASVAPRAISSASGAASRPVGATVASGGGGGGRSQTNRSGAGAPRSGAGALQLVSVSSGGVQGVEAQAGRLSRTNSKSRLLGGEDEV